MNETSSVKRKRETPKFCKYCSSENNKRRLRLYQINFEEAIYLCTNKQCTYPLKDENVMDFIVKRNNAEITLVNKVMKSPKKKSAKKNKILSSENSLSSSLSDSNKMNNLNESLSSLDDNFSDLSFNLNLFNNSANALNFEDNQDLSLGRTNNTPEAKFDDCINNIESIWNGIFHEDSVSPLDNGNVPNQTEQNTTRKEETFITFDDLISDCEITYDDYVSRPSN
ncbi:SUMO-specific isopeptidase USPL1-like [Centruroides sculpturatus]|uniref:SUMO-specific isopeptidase USPL1-like n=1 Tax=Centruroides sculpturatus TaxID=218467 RepID=UPI000C6CDDA5|nr:SUMO-specific isopeptidase USPL1-like [Centruroides sculpturatus]